jgi:hypothetical protein
VLDEVVVTEIMEFCAVAQHVVHVGEHRRRDREDRFLRSPTTLQPKKLRSCLLRKCARSRNRLWDEGLMTTRSIFMRRGERSS